MPNYYATTSILSNTGASRDTVSNNFAVIAEADITSGQMDDWADAIAGFYDDCRAASAMLGRAQNGHGIKFLAADGSVPNYPIQENSFNFPTAPGPIQLPNEVSLCVSYIADSPSGVPRARRRGRIYISGWNEDVNTSGRPTSAYIELLVDAYRDYAEAVNGISGLTAGVWSRVGATVYALNRCWVDNEWDTMRSRGGRATSRTELVIL